MTGVKELMAEIYFCCVWRNMVCCHHLKAEIYFLQYFVSFFSLAAEIQQNCLYSAANYGFNSVICFSVIWLPLVPSSLIAHCTLSVYYESNILKWNLIKKWWQQSERWCIVVMNWFFVSFDGLISRLVDSQLSYLSSSTNGRNLLPFKHKLLLCGVIPFFRAMSC